MSIKFIPGVTVLLGGTIRKLASMQQEVANSAIGHLRGGFGEDERDRRSRVRAIDNFLDRESISGRIIEDRLEEQHFYLSITWTNGVTLTETIPYV